MTAQLKRIAGWTGLIVVVLVTLLLVDLYTFELVVEDPGPYIVARRSDTPEQVLKFLPKVENDPEVTRDQLRVLVDRYRGKAQSPSLSPDVRRLWKKAYRRARTLLENRSDSAVR